MTCIFKNCALFSILLLMTTDMCCTLAQSTRATGTSTATIIKPVQLKDAMVDLTMASLMSDVTGDLVIRIAAAVAAALEDQGIEQASSEEQTELITECARPGATLAGCGTPTTPGVLEGDPVNSIIVEPFDASLGLAGIDVTIAYN